MASPATPWLATRARRPGARAGLFCFPHAGGAPGEYVRWADDLPGVQVWAVQFPGRATRWREPPFTRMAPLVGAVLESVPFGGRFALFGHSLGALVAYEVARALHARGGPRPVHLLVSGCPPPSGVRVEAPIHGLSGRDLLAVIERRWGPLPPTVRRDPELLERTVGCFRSDLEVVETYRHLPGEPLDCPVTALAGSGDPVRDRLDGWSAHTTGTFTRRVFPGGHFYFREQRAELLRVIDDSSR